MRLSPKIIGAIAIIGVVIVGGIFVLKNRPSKKTAQPSKTIIPEEVRQKLSKGIDFSEIGTPVTAKEAVAMCEPQAKDWQADAVLVGLENSYFVKPDGKGDGWFAYYRSPSQDVVSRFETANGECSLEYPGIENIEYDLEPIGENWVDSSELLEVGFTAGMPDDVTYTVWLGREYLKNTYGRTVWETYTSSPTRQGEEQGIQMDSVTKEVLQKTYD